MAYEEITFDQMDQYLKRAYHALHPKMGSTKGEIYYDLHLSDHVIIRVWTTIHPQNRVSVESGTDAIRVTMITSGGRPLMPKGISVKRTGRWRASLQDQIEDLIETYESQTEYWATRRKERDGESTDTVEAKPPNEKGEAFEGASYGKIKGGEWGVMVWSTKGNPGDEGSASTNGGQVKKVRLLKLEGKGIGRYPPHAGEHYELWSFEDVSGKGGTGRFASVPDEVIVESVAQRFLAGLV